MCLWPTINRLSSLLENAIAPDSPLLVHSSPLRPRDNPGGAPVLRFLSPSILRRSAIRALPKSRVNKATRAPEKLFVGMQGYGFHRMGYSTCISHIRVNTARMTPRIGCNRV